MQPHQLDALRTLLTETRVLSLAVLVDEAPVIGLLPFAVTDDSRALIVHASRLARHTRGLHEGAPFDALVNEPVTADVDPMQVKRATLRGQVREVLDQQEHAALRAAYLAKFPTAEGITELGDFAFYRLEVAAGRIVTGFAGAANITKDTIEALAGEG